MRNEKMGFWCFTEIISSEIVEIVVRFGYGEGEGIAVDIFDEGFG